MPSWPSRRTLGSNIMMRMACVIWRALRRSLPILLTLVVGAAAQKTVLPASLRSAPVFSAVTPPLLALPSFQPAAAETLLPQLRLAASLPAPVNEPKRRVLWSPPAQEYFTDRSIPKNERLERFIQMTTRFWDVKDLVSPKSGAAYSSYLHHLASPSSPLNRRSTPRALRKAARRELERVNELLPVEKETATALVRFKNEYSSDLYEKQSLTRNIRRHSAVARSISP